MPDGSPFDPDLQIINLWRAYQANELCHAALAALFNGLMSTAVAGPSRLQPAVLCRTFAEEVSARAGAANRLWGDWAGDAGAEGSGQERSLQEELVLCLDGTHGGAGNFAGLTAAVRLLATLWARWAGGDGDVLMLVRRHGGPSARSIASVVGTLEEHSSAATGEAVAAVLLRHAVREHLGIAARKLLSGGLDTYHFTLADGLLGDAVCRRFFDTNPRLGNLSRFLEDAAFHQNHRITADGSAFLRAHGLA
jgi:hypothetical protein